MPEVRFPRKGSLQYWPRKRARRIYPSVSTYLPADKPKSMLWAGYKVGMLHVMMVDNKKGSPSFGQEISVPVTVLETPPMKVVGIRAYGSTVKGMRVLTEVWDNNLPKELARKVNMVPKKTVEQMEKASVEAVDAKLIVATQPRMSGVGKKKPEVFEVGIGGKSAKEKIDFAKTILGKEISAKDVIKEGEVVDVIAVTKGKGTAGVVKRFGVKIQNRHAKKKLRHIGSLGPQTPRKIKWTIPQAGQLGFQTRSELNKRVLKIGDKGEEITPKSGFINYGVVRSGYVLLEGSTPGSKKRLIMMRPAIRLNKTKMLVPEIRQVVM
jgi:large subunit ribosomal protein L3